MWTLNYTWMKVQNMGNKPICEFPGYCRYSPIGLALSANCRQSLKVKFHMYWYTLILLQHFHHVLAYTDGVTTFGPHIVCADGALAGEGRTSIR